MADKVLSKSITDSITGKLTPFRKRMGNDAELLMKRALLKLRQNDEAPHFIEEGL